MTVEMNRGVRVLAMVCLSSIVMSLPVAQAECGEPLPELHIPDMRFHVELPVDFTPDFDVPCGSVQWEVLTGPPGLEIDGSGGRLYWLPVRVGEHEVTVQANHVVEGHVVASVTETFYASVDEFTMSDPRPRSYVGSTPLVPIVGRVHGPDFLSYLVDYADERSPNKRVLIAGPVDRSVPRTGTLATWDTSNLPDGGRFIVSLRVYLRDGTTSVVSNRVIVDRSVKAGWPQRVGPISHSVVVADLDGDGPKEVLAVTHFGELYVFNIDGSLRWKTARFGAAYSSPSVGDIDGDDRPDIAWTTSEALFVHDIDGRMLAGFPVAAPAGAEFRTTPALADLDGDDVLDVVLGARSKSPSGRGQVLAYGAHDGESRLLSGWPRTVEHFSLYATPSVGDLDGDGAPEVVAASFDRVYAWYANGIPVPDLGGVQLEAPIAGAVVNSGGSGLSSSQPAIADLDLDGVPEIIVGSNVLRTNGTPLAGWEGGKKGAINSLSPAVGDLDGNRENGLEVVLGHLAWHADGSPFRHDAGLANLGSAVLADCGDGDVDTMFGSRYPDRPVLLAVHPDGHLVEGYPKSLFGVTGDAGAPVVGDFDDDGLVDIAVAVNDGVYRGLITIYHMQGPNHDANHHWPMLGHDIRHSGTYVSPGQQR